MCLGPRCDSGQIHEGGEDQPIMTCNTCKFKTCFIHKMPWHPDQTCAEYEVEKRERMAQESASEEYLSAETQICGNPSCGIHVSKIDGCDHITCKSSPNRICRFWSANVAKARDAHTSFATYVALHGRESLLRETRYMQPLADTTAVTFEELPGMLLKTGIWGRHPYDTRQNR